MNEPDWLNAALAERRSQGLERHLLARTSVGGKFEERGQTILNFASNDYLDLGRDPDVVRGARDALARYGAGSTASRLVVGTLDLHEALEAALASHKGTPTSLVFGSGYLANLGIVAACVGAGDTVFADRLCHASMLDAVRLSGARLVRFHHNDVGHLRSLLQKDSGGGRRLVLTESVFSMDGDLSPLPELAELADHFGALIMVDEAHATGVFGRCGGGRVAELGLQGRVPLVMGTLSKAFGTYGGYVGCSAAWRQYLLNTARSFIYTTALPPAAVGAALAATRILQERPGLGAELLRRATFFRSELAGHGLSTADSGSQIIPILVGDNRAAVAAAEALAEQGIRVVAMRPPTVPPGTARLRLSVTLAHQEEDLSHASRILAQTLPSSVAR